MAVKRIPVPFCDECGEPWLPKFKLSDGTHNPIFDKPERSKRCGKCKTTRWNAAGVDKRRKVVPCGTEQGPAEVAAAEPDPPQVSMDDVLQTLDRPAPSTGRCCHMLYNCPQCHSKEAA